MRMPKQALIIPYRIIDNKVQYCIFKRSDSDVWQWVAGGAEDFDENILETARRELFEETGIKDVKIEKLELVTKIPVVNIVKDFMWGKDVFYADEYAFGVDIGEKQITISAEHKEYKWVDYEEARNLLRYDSNKNALWELNEIIKRKANNNII